MASLRGCPLRQDAPAAAVGGAALGSPSSCRERQPHGAALGPPSSCRERQPHGAALGSPSSCRERQPHGAARGSPEAGHFRRFRGYDYSRGASLFLTFNVEPKQDILGRIEAPGVLVHNEWGRLVDEKVAEIAARHAPLRVMKHVIMPNHAHLRVFIPPGMDKPLMALGAFVSAFKQSTSLLLRHRGRPGPLWQERYHDFICISAETIDAADAYIDNNARKRWLLEAPDRPMKVAEPLTAPRLPPDIWWAGVGATGLLDSETKIAAFRLSRSLPQSLWQKVIDCARRAAAQGYAIASTFISPCERVLFAALAADSGARMIKAGHKMLGCVYRPVGGEPTLFAERRLLLLSRQSEPDKSRRAGWLDLNANLAAIADRAVYARIEGGKLKW
ncbi:MAG: transposase [Kiritimatiellae bacterium]|nr:transposase [Kiritimatiellia bacterium]